MKLMLKSVGGCAVAVWCLVATVASAEGSGDKLRSGVFGGGPFYHDAATIMPAVREAGFETVIMWTLHVSQRGDLIYNDAVLVSDGQYVGDGKWPAQVASLKTAPTGVERIEWSVGSAGVPDFEHIQALDAAGGMAPGGVLARNFAALKATFPLVDAVTYDDESNYDVDSLVKLSLLLGDLRWHVSFTPYERRGVWQDVYQQVEAARPGLIDRVYLQTYAGGTGNDPRAWNKAFGQLKVDLGLWSKHGSDCRQGSSPEQIATAVAASKADIAGAWLWLLDDLVSCQGQYPIADYVRALHK